MGEKSLLLFPDRLEFRQVEEQARKNTFSRIRERFVRIKQGYSAP